jgi:predicted extracellular nuclease
MRKLLFSAFALSLTVANAQDCSELFFSEYVEGSGQNKALEVYNPTNASIDLSAYKIVRHSNGSVESDEMTLSGNIAAKDVVVITNGTIEDDGFGTVDSALWNMADIHAGAYPTPLHMNGNDAITLEKTSGTKIDVIGKVGQDPVSGWSDEAPDYVASHFSKAWTQDNTLIRKAEVKKGFTDFAAPFNPAAQFDSLPEDSWSNLGVHDCACNSISVVEETFTFIALAENGTIRVASKALVSAMSLVDLNGKTVYSSEINAYDFNRSVNLPKGVYIISLVAENGTRVNSKIQL